MNVPMVCITAIIITIIIHHAFNLYIDFKCWEKLEEMKK